MKELQTSIVDQTKAVAEEAGCEIHFDGPRWSEVWRCNFFAITFGSTEVEGAIFPADANFWNKSGLDLRFERVDFGSDAEMCAAIHSELRRALSGKGSVA